MNVNFYLQDKRKPETFIYLVIHFSGHKYSWTTGERITPKFWSDSMRAKRTLIGYDVLNALLDKMETTTLEFFRNAKAAGIIPSKQDFTAHMNSKFLREVVRGDKPDDVLSFLQMYIREKEGDKTVTNGTLNVYRRLLKHLLLFISKRKNKKISFEEINLEFHSKFTEYLYQQDGKDGKMKSSTVKSLFSKLKRIMNDAIERGYTTNIAHTSKKFTIKTIKAEKDYLNLSELAHLYYFDIWTAYAHQQIKEISKQLESGELSAHQTKIAQSKVEAYQHYLKTKEIPPAKEDYFRGAKALERVRDAYLVESFCGTRFSDFQNIKPEYFFERAGVLQINFKTKKSRFRNEATIPVHPIVKEIFERYNYNVPSEISNQKFNKNIKLLLKLAGFTERVFFYDNIGGEDLERSAPRYKLASSHQPRSNFVTNALDNGVNIHDVKNVIGVRSVEVAQGYYRGKGKESSIRIAQSAFFAEDVFKVG